MSSPNAKRLLEEVRDIMGLKHYSIHTERSYCDWIRRFVKFHKMSSRQDLETGCETSVRIRSQDRGNIEAYDSGYRLPDETNRPPFRKSREKQTPMPRHKEGLQLITEKKPVKFKSLDPVHRGHADTAPGAILGVKPG